MLQASVGTTAEHLSLDRGSIIVRLIDQLAGLPQTSLDRHLPQHYLEHALSIDLQSRNLPRQVAQSPRGAVANLEAPVGHSVEQRVEGFHRPRGSDDGHQPTADCEIFGAVQQVAHEDSYVSSGNPLQGLDRSRGYFIPGQELDRSFDILSSERTSGERILYRFLAPRGDRLPERGRS